MFDLSKPLGQIEGLSLYGDHERAELVYYLPDEIDLRLIAPGRPDIALQIFYPDESIIGGTEDLAKLIGSILSLGVQCTVSSSRRDRVLQALRASLGREDVVMAMPAWEDGAVQLLLLDNQGGGSATPTPGDDQIVLGVVGSRRPSLSDGELAALFHARLDRRGTALVAAALQGQIGSVAGVLYDLSFPALRPTMNLRMSADLNRCAEFIRTGLGVQVYYVSADVSATFGRMKEEGVIKVDLVSEASDPESERMVNEAVNDFYDVLMRELFRPTVSPAEALGSVGGAGAAVQTSIVKLSFAYTRVEHERIVEVDYRKRSATRRTHNPQAHLRQLASLAGGVDRVVQRVALSAAWRELSVEIAAPDAFQDVTLLGVEVVLWRGKDGVLAREHARDGGLRMPATAAPLVNLSFSRGDANPRRLAFALMPDEPPFYRWQARFRYADADDVDSPREVWSEPHVSTSSDLDIFPSILAPCHRIVLKLGVGLRRQPASVEARLIARDARGQVLAEKRLAVAADRPEAKWSIRRGEADHIVTEATLVYRYEGNAAITRPLQKLIDRELMANDPFLKTVTLAPLVSNAPTGLTEIVVIANYKDPRSDYQATVTRRLLPPDFRADDIVIPIVNPDDTVSWTAMAVSNEAQPFEVDRGASLGGVLPVIFSPSRRYRFEWIGPSPAALGLRWVRAFVRAKDPNGQVLESFTLEWRGEAIEGEKLAILPRDGLAEWSVERRFEDGRKETTRFERLDSDLNAVQG